MKYIVMTMVAALSFVACKKDKSGGLDQQITFDFTATEGKQLVKQTDTITTGNIRVRYVIEDGDNMVFTFQRSQDDPDAFDDEYTDIVRFEVPKGATKFEYQGDALQLAPAVYGAWGAWSGVPDRLITDGYIRGEQVEPNKWDVTIMVNVPEYEGADKVKTIFKSYTCSVTK